MGIDFSQYLGLPAQPVDPDSSPERQGRLRLYTNPLGQTFYVDRTLYRQLKKAQKQAKLDESQTRVDYYLSQTALPDWASLTQSGHVVKVQRGDQQNALFVEEAYTYPQGLRIKRTNGSAATYEWNDAGYRLSWVLGAETQRDSAQLARTLFAGVPEAQGGDYSENALPGEITTMAFIESNLSYRDFCDRFALDPANMPDYQTTMQLLQIFMSENQVTIANQAGANHNTPAGNLGNSTLTVKNATDRLQAAEATYLAALEANPATSDPSSRLAYFNPNANPASELTNTSVLPPLDPRDLPQPAAETFANDPSLTLSYSAYAQAVYELNASETFAYLEDTQPSRHRGFFGMVPEWFKQNILGAAFNVPKTERPAEVYFPSVDYFNSDDYFSGGVTRQLLALHYTEYDDGQAFEDWITTDMTWDGEQQNFTAQRRNFAYNKPATANRPQRTLTIDDLLKPNEAMKNFEFFWQQTRTGDGKSEWVCRIHFTDRWGLDPAETGFVLVLQDMGTVDGVHRFSRYWPIDATDFRPPSYYYDSTSDLALALMDLARLALPHLYPDDIVLIDDEKHWGLHETFKPTEYPGSPIPVSRVISNDNVSPVQLGWHHHSGSLLNFERGDEWTGGRRVPVLGSAIITHTSPYKNQVLLQGRSVVDYEGVFYVVTGYYNATTGLMTERYTEINPYAYYLSQHPHSPETQAAIDAALAQMAPYLSMNFYTSATTLPVTQSAKRKRLLIGTEQREQQNFTVAAQDAIPTQARVVEMGLAYLQVFIENLENDLAKNPNNSDLQFYLTAYQATYWQMRDHFEAWQSKYQEVLSRTKDWPEDARNKEIAFACDDLYRNEAFLHRLLMSVDLADDNMRNAAPTTYAVAMELKRALVGIDMTPFNNNLDAALRETPWVYANTFTAQYYVKQSERIEQVAFTPWGSESEPVAAVAHHSR